LRHRISRSWGEGQARTRAFVIAFALAVLLAGVATSQAAHLFSDTAGHTTLERVVTGDNPDDGYATLRSELVNGSYLVRDGAAEGNPAIPDAQNGRQQRRESLSYLGQLTDFQLADEESPARVEFLDPGASSAWRPQEALAPFIIDWSIRQMNLFAGASPVPQGDGSRAAMDFSLMTGDQADSAQRNETIWVRELLEGGTALNFNSGSTTPGDYDPTVHPSCAGFPPNAANRAEALRYTGVQDYDDYDETQTPLYYDPDDPRGSWAASGWPTYTGLMDRAQQIMITPAGTAVPSYVTNGNHDPLVQGNEDPVDPIERISTGCLKVLASTVQPGPGVLDPSVLLAPPSASMLVPPDPLRRYVSKPQIKAIYGANDRDHDHGFEFVDPAEAAASNGSASYYAWDPPEAPDFRFISIDTVSEGGQTAEGVGCGSANGNIDDPQFQWLERELEAATARDKLVVIYGHHPVRSLCAEVPDEAAQPCTVPHNHGDTPEHDQNPGCDLDPRPSEPLHLGRDPQPGDPRESFVELLDRFPHVVSYIAGHTHENNVEPFTRTGGTVWWGIETAATADWPVQHRLVEVMDNRDGTLSIFGTVLDHAGGTQTPASGTHASGFTSAQLASIGAEFTYNDPQAGDGTGEGAANDQNVELLVRDPRRADLSVQKTDSPDPVSVGQELTYTVTVTNEGPSPAGAVTLTDTLPASVTFGSADASQGSCLQMGATVTCDLGELAPTAEATVTITVTPVAAGTITNTATVDGAQIDPDSSDDTDVENTDVAPPTGYPRPRGATPLRASLVPAYRECLSPNRQHGAPLDVPSCSPPQQSSGVLTVGTLDSNGAAANSVGSARLDVVVGNPATTADEADVRVALGITDVRKKSDLSDYTGELQADADVRITDRRNGPGEDEAATTQDIRFPITFGCTGTADGSVGSTCALTTTFDAVVPGALREEDRSNWQFGAVNVLDGGPDGIASTAPNTLFATQGIFAP
jgi:uncharacterized repeat protein (TIGR01451 family)